MSFEALIMVRVIAKEGIDRPARCRVLRLMATPSSAVRAARLFVAARTEANGR